MFSLNAIRFLLAFVVGRPVLPRLRHPSAATLKTAPCHRSGPVFAYTPPPPSGVKYTSLSNAGFLCALPVVFTPCWTFCSSAAGPPGKLALVLVMAGDGHCPAHPVRRSAPPPWGRPVHPVRPVQRRLSPHH